MTSVVGKEESGRGGWARVRRCYGATAASNDAGTAETKGGVGGRSVGELLP